MNETPEQLLREVQNAHSAGVSRSELWVRLHDLAEAHYEPAIPFFRTFLDDPDWDWRLEGVRLLGFHYLFAPNSEIIGKLKQLLLTDQNDFVRSSAAAALGSQLTRMSPEPEWPDRALLQAMQDDIDEQVRLASFVSLLYTAGLPSSIVRPESEHLEETGRRPSIAEVRRILQEQGIEPKSLS